VGRAGNGNVEADAQHEVFENLAVFAFLDGLGFRADHFDAVLRQYAGAVQGHGRVQSCLATQRREQDELTRDFGFRISTLRSIASEDGSDFGFIHRHAHLPHLFQFAGDDFLHALGRDGFDVGAVGELRVGHDGGRVGVDEDDAVTFLLERFAGLRAGIIKLARLANDDRAGADDEDGVDVGAFGHREEFTIYDLRFTMGMLPDPLVFCRSRIRRVPELGRFKRRGVNRV
jgi:hypothetical protein